MFSILLTVEVCGNPAISWWGTFDPFVSTGRKAQRFFHFRILGDYFCLSRYNARFTDMFEMQSLDVCYSVPYTTFVFYFNPIDFDFVGDPPRYKNKSSVSPRAHQEYHPSSGIPTATANGSYEVPCVMSDEGSVSEAILSFQLLLLFRFRKHGFRHSSNCTVSTASTQHPHTQTNWKVALFSNEIVITVDLKHPRLIISQNVQRDQLYY